MTTVLTSYYNPLKLKNRAENYQRFKEELGHELLTLEVAFGNEPFTLTDSVKLRAEHPLWLKERLLRIGEVLLPKEQDYVCFLDADLVMENTNWMKDTRKLLKEYKAVHPYQTVDRLLKDGTVEKSYNSFGYQYSKGIISNDFEKSGHPGFSFACRREDFTLYEKSIAGTGDSLLLYAIIGQQNSERIHKVLRGIRLKHYLEWANECYKTFQGSLHYTEGNILHLYHGTVADRNYHGRMIELDKLNFNPYTDLYTNDDGLLQTNRPDLANWIINYLKSRNEDS